jgi:hypothetical protein
LGFGNFGKLTLWSLTWPKMMTRVENSSLFCRSIIFSGKSSITSASGQQADHRVAAPDVQLHLPPDSASLLKLERKFPSFTRCRSMFYSFLASFFLVSHKFVGMSRCPPLEWGTLQYSTRVGFGHTRKILDLLKTLPGANACYVGKSRGSIRQGWQ